MTKTMMLCAVLAIALCGCTSEGDATRALAGAGYTEIRITGYRVFGCADSDAFHTGFEAKGPTGRRVTGVVCSGWLKGATVRTD